MITAIGINGGRKLKRQQFKNVFGGPDGQRQAGLEHCPWREIGNRLHEALGEVERQKRTFEEQENEQQYAKT